MCRNHGSSSSAFLWVFTVFLVLLCFLFLLVYHSVNCFVVFDTVGTGDSGSVIVMEVVAGRGPGCWVGERMGEAAGKDQWQV